MAEGKRRKDSGRGKRAAARAAPAARSAHAGDVAQAAIDAAMRLAAEKGWRNVTLPAVADALGISLGQLYRHVRSRTAILAGLIRRIDAQVLDAGIQADAGESARDRLFDVMMRRYEALVPYREAIASIAGDAQREPLLFLCLSGEVRRSMAWMLEAAGIACRGPLGLLQVKGLALLHLSVLRVWLNDDSADLAKTMAALDRGLARIEPVARCLFKQRSSNRLT